MCCGVSKNNKNHTLSTLLRRYGDCSVTSSRSRCSGSSWRCNCVVGRRSFLTLGCGPVASAIRSAGCWSLLLLRVRVVVGQLQKDGRNFERHFIARIQDRLIRSVELNHLISPRVEAEEAAKGHC